MARIRRLHYQERGLLGKSYWALCVQVSQVYNAIVTVIFSYFCLDTELGLGESRRGLLGPEQRRLFSGLREGSQILQSDPHTVFLSGCKSETGTITTGAEGRLGAQQGDSPKDLVIYTPTVLA